MRFLTGRFDVTSVLEIDSTHWTLQANFADEVGLYGPADVAVNQRVFLYSAVDNVLRYRISAIVSNTSNPVEIEVEWDDDGSAIEPPSGIGAITAVSTNNSLPEEPSFSQQLLDEPLVTGIRAQTMRSKVDNLTGGGASASIKGKIIGAAITAGKPLSLRPDGKVIMTDSDAVDARNFIGVSLTGGASDGDEINAQLVGANLPGVLTGLGFAPGSDIFMDETSGGYTDDPDTALTNGDDDLIKLGVADCAAGVAGASATDLILFPEVIARV